MLIFDLIIFGSLLFGAVFIVLILSHKLLRDQDRLREFLLLFVSLAWITVFYGSFIAPYKIQVPTQDIQLSDSPTNHIQLAIISDIHLGPYTRDSLVQNILDVVNTIQPDAILLLGDFVSGPTEKIRSLEQFSQITTLYPTYAVLGNHDYDLGYNKGIPDQRLAQVVEQTLEAQGVRVLKNESELLGDTNLQIAGIDDIWTRKANLQATLSQTTDSQPVVLLSHNPDIVFDLVNSPHRIDAIISGHTHGGQIRLPFLGPIGPIPTELGQQYDKGLFNYHDTQLFITSGIGASGTRARLFNPPEIVSLDLSW